MQKGVNPMTHTTHTQGPWETTAFNQTIPDPVKEEIKRLKIINAELIEALQSLEALVTSINEFRREGHLVKARAAIAKAKGEADADILALLADE